MPRASLLSPPSGRSSPRRRSGGLDDAPDGLGPADLVARTMPALSRGRELIGRDDAGDGHRDHEFISRFACYELGAFYGGNPVFAQQFYQVARTMTGISGQAGGFAIPYDVGTRIIDRARALSAVWGMVRWVPTKFREWSCPINAESSRAAGSRWGGLAASTGLGETTMPSATDGKIANAQFVNNRYLIFSQVSRDAFSDAASIGIWLQEAGYKEMAAEIENAVINGVVSAIPGIIKGPATVTVAKGSTGANAIGVANVDAMWQAIPEANSYNAVWMCNKKTAGYIDTLAASGQWPEGTYLAAGVSPRWPYATLKGRPLVWTEFAPVIGNPGDLIVWDPTQWLFSYMPLNKLNPSPLAWDVGIDHVTLAVPGFDPEGRPLATNVRLDALGTGMMALPEDSLEVRMSGERFFDQDILACAWKLRMDFQCIWTGTITGVDGNTYGPAATTAQR